MKTIKILMLLLLIAGFTSSFAQHTSSDVQKSSTGVTMQQNNMDELPACQKPAQVQGEENTPVPAALRQCNSSEPNAARRPETLTGNEEPSLVVQAGENKEPDYTKPSAARRPDTPSPELK